MIFVLKSNGSLPQFLRSLGYTTTRRDCRRWISLLFKPSKTSVYINMVRTEPKLYMCVKCKRQSKGSLSFIYRESGKLYRVTIEHVYKSTLHDFIGQKGTMRVNDCIDLNFDRVDKITIRNSNIFLHWSDLVNNVEVKYKETFENVSFVDDEKYTDTRSNNYTMLQLNRSQSNTISSYIENMKETGFLDHLIWHSTGSGKTINVINMAHMLYIQNKIDKCFIFTPSNVIHDIENDVRRSLGFIYGRWPSHFVVGSHDNMWTHRSSIYDHMDLDGMSIQKYTENIKLMVVFNDVYQGNLQTFVYDSHTSKYISLGKQFVLKNSPYGHIVSSKNITEHCGTTCRNGVVEKEECSFHDFRRLMKSGLPKREKQLYTWITNDDPFRILCFRMDINNRLKYEVATPNDQGFYGCSINRHAERVLIVIDESHRLSEIDSIRYSYVYHLCKYSCVQGVLLMSATPISNSIANLDKQLSLFKVPVYSHDDQNVTDIEYTKQFISYCEVDYDAIDLEHHRRVYPKTMLNLFLLPIDDRFDIDEKFLVDYQLQEDLCVNTDRVYSQKNIDGKYKKIAQYLFERLTQNTNIRIAVYCSKVTKGVVPLIHLLNERFETSDEFNISMVSVYTGYNVLNRYLQLKKYNSFNNRLLLFSDAGAQGMNLKFTDELHVIGMNTSCITTTHQAIGRARRPRSHWFVKNVNASKKISKIEKLKVYIWLESDRVINEVYNESTEPFYNNYPIIKKSDLSIYNQESKKNDDVSNYMESVQKWYQQIQDAKMYVENN